MDKMGLPEHWRGTREVLPDRVIFRHAPHTEWRIEWRLDGQQPDAYETEWVISEGGDQAGYGFFLYHRDSGYSPIDIYIREHTQISHAAFQPIDFVVNLREKTVWFRLKEE